MKSMKIFLSFLLIANLVGCATHSTMRGSVAMKISDTEAHVCMGDKEVKVGDKVTAFQNVCNKETSRLSRSGNYAQCQKVKIGSGVVTELINDHYSVVKFDNNVKFGEGTIVEKQ